MKRLIVLLAGLTILSATPAWGASYYGCASASITADNTFCTTATESCAGDTPVSAATALAGTHTLFANGCTITIPEAQTITATKLSNKDDGGLMVDGGQFTILTTGWSTATTINADLETGATTGAVLAITGTGNLNPVVTIIGNITAGTASAMYGLLVSHTVGTVVVGSAVSLSTITSGSSSTAHGIRHSSAGPLTIYGTATAVSGFGLSNASAGGGTSTFNGNCVGSDTVIGATGCYASSAGSIVVTGNLVQGAMAPSIQGRVTWAPSDVSKYVQFTNGTDIFASQAPAAANVTVGTSVVDPADGSYDAGTAEVGGSTGGGAWGW